MQVQKSPQQRRWRKARLVALLRYSPTLIGKVRSEAVLQAADGAPCTLRIASFVPGLRCAPPDTTVYCHLGNIGQGMATKESDINGAFGCSVCHDLTDGRMKSELDWMIEKYPRAVLDRILNGHFETLGLLACNGIIRVPGATIIGDMSNFRLKGASCDLP